MTLEYRCSNCGERLETTNADPFNHQMGALVKALDELQSAEAAYRMCHDLDGDGHINTERAWDKLRQAGHRARAALTTVGALALSNGQDGGAA